MGGEQRGADGRVDSVGTDDEFRLELRVRCGDTGRASVRGAGVGEPGLARGVHGPRGQQGGDAVDQGGPVKKDQGPAEAFCGGRAVRAGEPPAARGAHPAVALPRGQLPDVVAEADDVERTLTVGGESDAGADRLQGGGLFQDGDLPAASVQGDGGGQAADTTADDDGTGLGHGSSSHAHYMCSDTPSVLQL